MPDLMINLGEYRNEKIAIYGLGTETKKVLLQLEPDIQVLGLLDGYKTEGNLYGLPVISMEEAIRNGIKLILVVARPGSCKAIAKKIGGVCRENGIVLIDVRGNDLCKEKRVTYHFRGVEGTSKKKLQQLAADYDVISVDLFDTLIMRQVLFPTDIFTLVDSRLKEQGCHIDGFCGKRMESEKYMSRLSAPTLAEIYEYMINTYDIPNVTPGSLADLEWAIDCEVIVPRQEMCDLLRELGRAGKKIYIVSDTFYHKQQLVNMLESCGIDFYTDILASCEYGTGKTQQLFDRLKEKTAGRSCLHIGDDLVADIENAEKNGIDACQIYSSIELLDMAGYLGLWDRIETFSDRLKTGMFIAKLFNSPFQFEEEERRISVLDAKNIGYLFFAPMISDFTLWFEEQVESCGIENVLFCARDGHLIKKLYDELQEKRESVYFLTSRIAAIRAGMETEEDIRYVEEMKFSGTLQDQLRERFGVEAGEEEAEKSLLDYSAEILAHSGHCRKNYKKYIEGLHMSEGDIAFFDFVAKGTSQMYIGRLVENHLKGFYFLQLEEEHMRGKGLDITPFYTREEMDTSAIFNDYYILETMLTAPEASVREFDEDGRAVYAEETRKKEDVRCFLCAQEGIYDYFQTYLKICPESERKIGKKIDEVFLALVHKIMILDQRFLDLTVEDPFFNRLTDMTDLI